MTSLTQLREEIAGVFARKNISERVYIENDEVCVEYTEGEIDPSLIVQVVERETGGNYVGEKDAKPILRFDLS